MSGVRSLAAAAAAVIVLCGAALAARPAAPRRGETAPDFTYRDWAGQRHQLSEFAGHYVLLDFWASWCVPCRAEMKTLREAYARDHAQGLDVLGLDADQDPARGEKFLRAAGLPWPQAASASTYGVTHRVWSIRWLPTLILLDPHRQIVWVSGNGGRGLSGKRLLAALNDAVGGSGGKGR
ncbi:MAG: TlpA family protein disulfide reductase [Terriglobales bacterium]